MIRRVLPIAVMLLAGCGADVPSSGGGGAPPAPPPPVVLQSLAILPGDATITQGDVTALSVLGTYSNGNVIPVTADWTSSAAAVTLDAASGTAVVCTGAQDGTATVTATVGEVSDSVVITVDPWSPAAGPGPVYGDETGGLARYPADGSAPTYLSPAFSVPGRGIARSPAGDWLYVLGESLGSFAIGRVSLSNNSQSSVVTLLNSGDGDTENPWGMEVDGQGRIVVYFYDSGRIVRHDPSAGTTTTINTVGASIDIGLDSAGNPYWTPLLASAGSTMLSTSITFAPGFSFNATWALAPSDEAAYFVVGGVTFNAKNECFAMNSYGTRVYKIVDLNGDGDATDAGELTTFANLTGFYGDTFTFGLAATRGTGVLINRQGGAIGDPSGKLGVWWAVDRDDDGTATDSGEVTLYNSAEMDSGLDGGCLAAPK